VSDIVEKICRLNEEIRDFWSHADGWAPSDSLLSLDRSRLDRQVALSHCLAIWDPEEHSNVRREGALILGWANLGALVEGTLKWFLSVYRTQVPGDAIKRFGNFIGPEEATLEQLRVLYLTHCVWYDDAERRKWDPWLAEIRDRRNAVHAYRDRDIGTYDDLYLAIERYLDLINTLDGRVPYP